MKKTILCSLVSWLFPMLMLAQPFSFHADQLAWSDTTGHFFPFMPISITSAAIRFTCG